MEKICPSSSSANLYIATNASCVTKVITAIPDVQETVFSFNFGCNDSESDGSSSTFDPISIRCLYMLYWGLECDRFASNYDTKAFTAQIYVHTLMIGSKVGAA